MTINLGNLFIDGETLTDTSNDAHSVVNNSSVTISTVEKEFGNSSFYIDGSNYLEVANHTNLQLDMSDFTIDFWMKNTNIETRQYIISKMDGASGSAGEWSIWHRASSDGYPGLNVQHNGTIWNVGASLTEIKFHHIALTRTGGTLRFFLDGTLIDSTPITGSFNSTEPLRIGQYGTHAAQRGVGYIDNFRIIKGEALWTENFDSSDTDALKYTANYTIDLCEGGTPIESGHYSNQDATLAFQNTTGDYWATAWEKFFTSGDYIGYIFPTAKQITKYTLKSAFTGNGDPSMKTWTFQGSNNGSSWTNLQTITNLTPALAVGEKRAWTFSNTNSYTQYRFLVDSIVGGSYILIDEIEMMENVANSAPTANPDSVTLDENTNIVIDLLANDTDPETDDLSITNLTSPSHGALIDHGDGTVTYTPTIEYFGADTFDYTITDGEFFDTNTASITITKVENNPNRAGNTSGLYHSKRVNLKGKALEGFIRPTIAQFFTSAHYEDIISNLPNPYSILNSSAFTHSNVAGNVVVAPNEIDIFFSDHVGANSVIKQGALLTPGDLATYTFTKQYTVNTTALDGFWIDQTGTKLFMMQYNSVVHEYSMSIPWDIDSTSYVRKSNYGVNGTSMWMRPDGKIVWMARNAITARSSMDPGWDLPTMRTDTSYNVDGNGNGGMTLNDEGTKFYQIKETTGILKEHTLAVSGIHNTETSSRVLRDGTDYTHPATTYGDIYKRENNLYINTLNPRQLFSIPIPAEE